MEKDYWGKNFFGSKLNSGLLLVLIVLMVIALMLMSKDREKYFSFLGGDKEAVEEQKELEEKDETIRPQVKDTYTYTNHGFSIELPKGFIPKEETGSMVTSISLPNGDTLLYISDAVTWEKSNMLFAKDCPPKDTRIGETMFKLYECGEQDIYWLKKGNVAYDFRTGVTSEQKSQLINLLSTFKFVGWPQIEGNKEDLVSFSIKPGQEVTGKVKVTGVMKGGYFFEGNILVSILDANKKVTSYGPGYANATTDWMTTGNVSFSVDFDFSKIPAGNYYIRLIQDDPRDESERAGYIVKYVLIPIVVK